MNQADLLTYAVSHLERLKIPYMIVGSLASGAYGEPRLTQDIDIVIDLPLNQVDSLCAAFPPEEFYVSTEAARAAVAARGQFNVIYPDSGDKIDFMLSRKDPWGIEQLTRRQPVQLTVDHSIYAASPEDVIIAKMLYYQEGGSEKHLRDIAGILKVTGAEVDRDYVERWAKTMSLVEIWTAILRRIS